MLLMSCECTSAHAVNSTIYDTPEKSNETVLRFPKTVVGKYGLEKTAFMVQRHLAREYGDSVVFVFRSSRSFMIWRSLTIPDIVGRRIHSPRIVSS